MNFYIAKARLQSLTPSHRRDFHVLWESAWEITDKWFFQEKKVIRKQKTKVTLASK